MELYDGLPQKVAEVLRSWAQIHDRHYELDHWLVNGRSRAAVAVVRETDAYARTNTMLVLKVLEVQDGSVADLEYARHRKAEKEAPDAARRHLSTFVHQAIPAPDQRWITFQRIAGRGLERTEVLTVLLRRMLGINEAEETAAAAQIVCAPTIFADACRRIVSGVLNDWAGSPYAPPRELWTIEKFLRWHLQDQLAPGGRLYDWSLRYPGDTVVVDSEATALPNPFAAAQGRYFSDTPALRPFLGRSHGDLHTDNALIQVRPTVDTDSYYLIDTALYESEGPITRDPAHLVLYIIARAMEAIDTPVQQRALIELLLDPVGGPADLIPGWLAMVIQQIDAEGRAWAEEFEPIWRAQVHLSLAACAMLFLGRTSTRTQDKPWFLRLAARALGQFAADHPQFVTGEPPKPPESTAGTWIGWFCRDRQDLERLATQEGHLPEFEQFHQDALHGVDRTDDYREFVRRIGGIDPNVRFGTRGNEGLSEPEQYQCPLDLCERREQRPPGGPKPLCHMRNDGRLTLRSSLD